MKTTRESAGVGVINGVINDTAGGVEIALPFVGDDTCNNKKWKASMVKSKSPPIEKSRNRNRRYGEYLSNLYDRDRLQNELNKFYRYTSSFSATYSNYNYSDGRKHLHRHPLHHSNTNDEYFYSFHDFRWDSAGLDKEFLTESDLDLNHPIEHYFSFNESFGDGDTGGDANTGGRTSLEENIHGNLSDVGVDVDVDGFHRHGGNEDDTSRMSADGDGNTTNAHGTAGPSMKDQSPIQRSDTTLTNTTDTSTNSSSNGNSHSNISMSNTILPTAPSRKESRRRLFHEQSSKSMNVHSSTMDMDMDMDMDRGALSRISPQPEPQPEPQPQPPPSAKTPIIRNESTTDTATAVPTLPYSSSKVQSTPRNVKVKSIDVDSASPPSAKTPIIPNVKTMMPKNNNTHRVPESTTNTATGTATGTEDTTDTRTPTLPYSSSKVQSTPRNLNVKSIVVDSASPPSAKTPIIRNVKTMMRKNNNTHRVPESTTSTGTGTRTEDTTGTATATGNGTEDTTDTRTPTLPYSSSKVQSTPRNVNVKSIVVNRTSPKSVTKIKSVTSVSSPPQSPPTPLPSNETLIIHHHPPLQHQLSEQQKPKTTDQEPDPGQEQQQAFIEYQLSGHSSTSSLSQGTAVQPHAIMTMDKKSQQAKHGIGYGNGIGYGSGSGTSESEEEDEFDTDTITLANQTITTNFNDMSTHADLLSIGIEGETQTRHSSSDESLTTNITNASYISNNTYTSLSPSVLSYGTAITNVSILELKKKKRDLENNRRRQQVVGGRGHGHGHGHGGRGSYSQGRAQGQGHGGRGSGSHRTSRTRVHNSAYPHGTRTNNGNKKFVRNHLSSPAYLSNNQTLTNTARGKSYRSHTTTSTAATTTGSGKEMSTSNRTMKKSNGSSSTSSRRFNNKPWTNGKGMYIPRHRKWYQQVSNFPAVVKLHEEEESSHRVLGTRAFI